MTLLSPFFQPRAHTRTNFEVLLSEASKLSDEGVLALGEALDWQEPVVALTRFKNSDYDMVDASACSPLEILVLSGDRRMIGLLATPERVAAGHPRIQQGSLRRSGYDDVALSTGMVNAAIRTGNVQILGDVLKLVTKADPGEASRWFNERYVGASYTPSVCLASQKNLPEDTLREMWMMMEEVSISAFIGESGVSPAFKKEVKERVRLTLLADASRMGNVALASMVAKERGEALSFDDWRSLLGEGNITWAIDFLASNEKFGPDRDRDPPYERKNPLRVVAEEILTQRNEIGKTFAKHPDKARFLGINDQNFVGLMEKVESSSGSKSLLSVGTEHLSECLGWPLVAWGSGKAAKFLSSQNASMSIDEAKAWMTKIAIKPACISSLRKRLKGCPPQDCASSQWADEVMDHFDDWKGKNPEVFSEALVVVSSAIGHSDLHSEMRDAGAREDMLREVVSAQATYLSTQSAPARGKGRSVRL